MKDKDTEIILRNQVVIINLIGALAKKVTGEMPIVTVMNKDGSFFVTEPTIDNITWEE